MNKRGTGPVGVVFLYLFFMVNYFVWMGGWLNDICKSAVQTASLSGVEAFLLSNFGLIVVIGCSLGMMAYLYFVGGTA